MGTTDLYTADFPHGTKEGYEMGCRGAGACPNHLTEEMTCKAAFNRYNSDWDYRKAIDAGVPWVEPEPVAAVPVKAAPKPVAKPTPPVVAAKPVEVVAPDTRAERSPAKEFPHGTTAGYQRGCVDDTCPRGEKGLTCREAKRAYQREYNKRRVAAKNAAMAAAAVEAEPVVDETASIVVEDHATADELDVESDPVAVLQAMVGELQVARQELAIARQRVVELSLELDVEKMRPRRVSPSVSVEPTAAGGVTVIVNVA